MTQLRFDFCTLPHIRERRRIQTYFHKLFVSKSTINRTGKTVVDTPKILTIYITFIYLPSISLHFRKSNLDPRFACGLFACHFTNGTEKETPNVSDKPCCKNRSGKFVHCEVITGWSVAKVRRRIFTRETSQSLQIPGYACLMQALKKSTSTSSTSSALGEEKRRKSLINKMPAPWNRSGEILIFDCCCVESCTFI